MTDERLDEGVLRPITDPKELADINDLKILANDNIKSVRRGRYAVFALAGFYLVAGLVQFYLNTDGLGTNMLIGAAIMTVLYLLAAGLTYRERWAGAGIIAGLALYLIDHLSNLFIEPAALWQGILWKVAIVAYFASAIMAWFKLKGELTQLQSHPVATEELRGAWKLREMRRSRRSL